MKVFDNTTRISFVIIFFVSLSFAEARGQSASDFGPTAGLTEPGQDTISSRQQVMLIGLLDSSFKSLADNDRRGRRVGGYVLLGLGIGTGLGGAATLAFGEGDDARTVGLSLLGGGILLGGLSLIPLRVKSETERIYAEFSRAPAETPDHIRRKFYFWEHRFEELARKSRRERIIGGVTSIVAGAMASLFVVEGSDRDKLNTFVWPAVGGVTSLIFKSDTENRYETYLRAKEDILERRATPDIQFGMLPLPRGGLVGTVRVRF